MILTRNIKSERWTELYRNTDFKSPFQTIEFANLHKDIPGYSSEAIAVEEDNRYLAAMVIILMSEPGIKKYFSSRAIIYGGPLIGKYPNAKAGLDLILNEALKKVKVKPIYSEIRCSFDYTEYENIFSSSGWKFQPHLNVHINLKDLSQESILNKMKYNRRREIKKTLKNGVNTGIAKNLAEVSKLYSILKDLYKENVKLPLPGLGYFEALYHSEIGKVFIVKHKEQIIGGCFCFFYQESSINTLYYAGLRNYHKKIYPTHIAIFEAIKFGLENHLTHIDLMGAGKPDVQYGVRDYKIQFGGDLVNHGRYLLINKPFLFNLGKIYIRLSTK